MILRDTLELVVVLNSDTGRQGLQVTGFGEAPNVFPIGLTLDLHRLDAKLPRTLEASLFLHAIRRGAVVSFHGLKVAELAMLL